MPELYVSINQVRLHFRHAQSLKDKRQVMRSIIQKLRNKGFSVCECGDLDTPKFGSLGFTYAGSSHSQVDREQTEAKQLFMGNFEVVSYDARLDSLDSLER